MTCQDCIHFDVCGYHITELTPKTVNECNHFKPKSRFVEVVRCKDCWRFVNNKEAFTTYCRRGLQNSYVKSGDFCSYGEKSLKERGSK